MAVNKVWNLNPAIQINLSDSLNPRGEWDSSVAYKLADVVSYNGTSYVALQDGTNKTPESNLDYWQVLAEKGEKGDQGIQGIQGIQGEQGIQGNEGPMGPQGYQGEQGIQGLQGDKGLDGQGFTLSEGWGTNVPFSAFQVISYQGRTWVCKVDHTADQWTEPGIGVNYEHYWQLWADKGEQGIQGIQGDQGVQGLQGEKGDQGDQGIHGEQGIKGDTGDAGAAFEILGTVATSADLPLTGDAGDGYIVTAGGGHLWVWVPATSDWQDVGQIVGPQGSQGIQGIQGEKGDKGDTGAQGVQGIQGVKGDTGSTGATGSQGIQGVKGDTGNTGATGATGPGANTVMVKVIADSTPLVVGTNQATFVIPLAMNGWHFTGIGAHVFTNSSSGLPTIVVNKNGTNVFSTNLTIDANEADTSTAATPAVIKSDGTQIVATGDVVSVDVTVAGTGTKGLEIRFTLGA